jgi:hypothetical protein
MWAMAGFRYQVGTDFLSYKVYFDRISDLSYADRGVEVGYYILNKIAYLINTNSTTIFLMTSFITLLLIFRTIHKYSSRIELSLFLFISMYFYFSSFNIVRQYLAVAIVFYSIKYLLNQEFKKYLCCILLATTFHTTAIFVLVFYKFFRKNFTIVHYLIGMILSFCLLPLILPMINLVGSIYNKYEGYSTSFNYGSSSLGLLLIGSIFLFAILHKDKLVELNKNNLIYINATFLALILQILGTDYVLISRIGTYFYIFTILLIPDFLLLFNKYIRVTIYIGLLLIFFFYFDIQLIRGVGEILPYKSVFS